MLRAPRELLLDRRVHAGEACGRVAFSNESRRRRGREADVSLANRRKAAAATRTFRGDERRRYLAVEGAANFVSPATTSQIWRNDDVDQLALSALRAAGAWQLGLAVVLLYGPKPWDRDKTTWDVPGEFWAYHLLELAFFAGW